MLPVGNEPKLAGDSLPLRGREVEPQVERDQVSALPLGALEQLGGSGDASRQPIKPGDDDGPGFARPAGCEQAGEPATAALPAAGRIRLDRSGLRLPAKRRVAFQKRPTSVGTREPDRLR